jgi:hypothetical protein
VSVKVLPPLAGRTLLVIDFMMLLRMICTEKCDCKTFGELSDKLLGIVMSQRATFTAVVGDNYHNDSSIKSEERSRRGVVEMQEIRNPTSMTPIPKQRKKMFTNLKTKANISNFIMEDWADQLKTKLYDDQEVHLAGGFTEPTKAKLMMKGLVRDATQSESDQEEADSRMFLHVAYGIEYLHPDRVVVWSIGTDVAALCPRYCVILGIEDMYFKTGMGNQKRYIPMHLVAADLGQEISLLLPVLHALSGCDSTSAFYNLGKEAWMTVVQSHPNIRNKLKLIGTAINDIPNDVILACSKLVCLMYGKQQINDLNVARYELFAKKKLTSALLPPTHDSFVQHLRRVNYQS